MTLGVAIALIVIATLLPTNGVTGSTSLWCMVCGPRWLADVISNVALFVPLGVALSLVGLRLRRALVVSASLSITIELLQSVGLPPGRSPAFADWAMNCLGALLGALLVTQRAVLVNPAPRAARRLLAGWTMVALAVLLASDWALSPATASVGATSTVTPSPLPFTPGYGWYAARSDSASVNGVALPHAGTGPIMALAERTDTVTASVTVSGRDSRDGVVPIVFVHAARDTFAYLLLGQRGNSAIVGTALNATRVGLASPDLALPSVFEPEARARGAPVRLTAIVTHDALSLTAQEAGRDAQTATLTLSPLLGWTLVQSSVRVGSAFAPFMTGLWMLAWAAPWVFWATRATKRRER
ncbi:MAG: VanZ family protein [Gemmatimonas sp.]